MNLLKVNDFNSALNHSAISSSKNYHTPCQAQYSVSLAAAEVPLSKRTKSQKSLKCLK